VSSNAPWKQYKILVLEKNVFYIYNNVQTTKKQYLTKINSLKLRFKCFEPLLEYGLDVFITPNVSGKCQKKKTN
jgi:hypothetical protein